MFPIYLLNQCRVNDQNGDDDYNDDDNDNDIDNHNHNAYDYDYDYEYHDTIDINQNFVHFVTQHHDHDGVVMVLTMVVTEKKTTISISIMQNEIIMID